MVEHGDTSPSGDPRRERDQADALMPDAAGDEPAGAGNEPTIPLPAVNVDGKRGSNMGRQVAVFAAVGTVALLAIVSALVGGSSGDDAEAETADRLSEVCEASVVPLIEAVEEWQGVGNWAAKPSETPDVGTLAMTAIEELATVSATSDLSVTAVALRRELDAEAANAEVTADAVRTALGEATDSLAAASPPAACDVDRLRAAVDLG